MSMRQKANYSLLLLAILFLVAVVWQVVNGVTWWSKAFIFITEAGLVGALADWFAVTALFRHPLGFRWLPHTAIVPNKREKLIDGVVYLVQEQLLSKQLIKQQLQQVNLVQLIIDYIDKWKSKNASIDLLPKLLPSLLKGVQTEKTAVQLEQLIKKQLTGKVVSQYASKLLKLAAEQRFDHTLVVKLLDIAKHYAKQPSTKPFIRQLLEDEKNKMVDSSGGGWFAKALFHIAEFADAVNLDEAAEVLYNDLLKLIEDLYDENHEVRVLLREQLALLAEELEQSESMKETISTWSEQLLQQLTLSSPIQYWLEQLIAYLQMSTTDSNATKWLHFWSKRLLNAFWEWFKQDEQSKAQVEQALQHFIAHAIQTEYKVIGKIVRTTLDTFSEEKLVQFIESKVEVDLQRIRVNGALIGSAVGAILYVFLQFIYDPILFIWQ